MILLDSGYLIALFMADDALHSRALSWSKCVQESVIVTEHVVCEAVNYLSEARTRQAAHVLVDYIKNDPACELIYASAELFRAGLILHRERPDKEWSLTDCISFHVMREREIKRALAYDHHFQQAGFEALLRQDPP